MDWLLWTHFDKVLCWVPKWPSACRCLWILWWSAAPPGFVGLCTELHCVHQGRDTLWSRGCCNGRDAGGDSSRAASAISALTWDEVSTSWTNSFGWWGRDIRMTTGCSLFRVELLDLWPDVSSIAWDKRSLTSWSCCPLLLILVGGLMGTGYLWWWKACQEAIPSGLAPPPGVMGCQFLGRHVCLQ